MEVHHHPDTEKKGFKEYLLEGLMIFLAVTLGFFAESFREHLNNGEKEKVYIHSLLNNMGQDIMDLENTIRENEGKLAKLDSLLMLAGQNINEPANRALLYKYAGYISFYSAFSSNDATMVQLKNAGGLQFIRRENVADSIARYDEAMRSIYAAETPYAKAINDAMDAASEVLRFDVWHNSVSQNADKNSLLPLLNNDPAKINFFFNKIFLERGWTVNYLQNLRSRLPYAKRLSLLLKEKYNAE